MKLLGPAAWWHRLTRAASRRAGGHADFADMGTAFGLEASLETDASRWGEGASAHPAGDPHASAAAPQPDHWLRPR